MIQVISVPAFTDNYIWLITNEQRQFAAVVDPGDAQPVIEELQRRNMSPVAILITHHHRDHTGGIEKLLEAYPGLPVYGPASEYIAHMTRALGEGQQVVLEELGLSFMVMDVPGHTAGHIAYYGEGSLFCGDTLFAAGCGRLFEGTPHQMYTSLERLAALPDDTLIYCTHEYTQSNLRFAQAVEPDNLDIAERVGKVAQLRAHGKMTLPSNLALEKLTNPFLRTAETSVKQKADERNGRDNRSGAEVFASLRAWKDTF